MTGWGTRKCGEEGFLSTQADAFAGSEGKNKSPCFVRNDGVVAGALRNAERRDFSYPQGDPSQEARGRTNRLASFEMTGWGGGAQGNAERRDFSLRRPPLSQEAKAEEKVGLLRSK
jgi:hypothetical protein